MKTLTITLSYILGHFKLQFYRKICLFFFSEFLIIRMFVKNSIFALHIYKNNNMSSRDVHCPNLDKLCHICGNLLGKKALGKEKYTTQLHSVFFINITKDLQCIHPRKICMKCYLLMNRASKRNSTISLKTYENWCQHDEHSCQTCVKVTEISKGTLGKIKNISINDRRGRPSISKLFWSQEDLDMLSAKCPPDNLPIDIETSYFKEKWNPLIYM